MRKLLFILFLPVFSKAQTPLTLQKQDSIDVVLILGESNASGQALNNTLLSRFKGSRVEINIQRNVTGVNGKFQTLNINANADGGNNQIAMNGNPTATAVFGWEYAMAQMVDSGLLRNPTYLIKTGVGGTKIADWLPTGTWEPQFRPFIDSAFNQLNRMGVPYRVYVWETIGLNDAVAGTLVDSFISRLSQQRTYLRSRYGISTAQWFYTRFSNTGTSYTFTYASAIDGIRLTDAKVHSIPCDGATYNTGETNVHWNLAGLGTIAHNMMDTMFRLSGRSLLLTDYYGQGRGLDVWINRTWTNTSGQGVNVPAGNSTRPPTNYYQRFLWNNTHAAGSVGIEGTTLGSYDWTDFDVNVHRAMDNHQMFSFRVMPVCDQCGGTVPAYVQTLIEANANANLRGYTGSDGMYVPNWNNPDYLARYRAMLVAVKAHIDATSYTPSWSGSPIPYSKVIYQVDIGGFGNFGEWHQFPWVNDAAFPTRIIPTQTTYDSLINMNLNVFPLNQAMGLIAVFGTGAGAAGTKYEPPTEVGYRLLTSTNGFGQIGWRRDNWGDSIYNPSLLYNSRFYNPGTGNVFFQPLIMSKYKFAPIAGEPLNGLSGDPYACGSAYCDLPIEAFIYHASSIGNGNLASPTLASTQANLQMASRAIGYKLLVGGGSMTTTLTANTTFNINQFWTNVGSAPTYLNWRVRYELRTGSTVVWTGTSSFNPKPLQPGSTLPQNDNFTLGAVSTGTYNLYMIAEDPNGYMVPLDLLIANRGADGFYPIRSSITINSGTSSIPPTAQAGGPFSITLPLNSVIADGSTSFGNGGATISSYAWTQLSGGPNTAVIQSPSSAATSITGLIAGTYNFQLQVTDNHALTGLDTLIVVVNAASPTGSLSVFTSQTPGGQGGTLSAFGAQTPSGALFNDGQGLNIGVKFRSTVNTNATGVRFYKQVGNNGTHQGELYNSAGTLLASGTFTNETASGWQILTFSSPVAITANTTYIAAYFTPNGTYADDNAYFSTAVTNSTLSLLADGTDGPNGVYKYNATPAFPSLDNTHKPNYWVDVIVNNGGNLINDGQGVSLGMKFTTSIDAFATGVRFYKVLGNNGVHVGELYSSTGIRLATATFTTETTSGWQYATFDAPVLIQAGNTYVVSYFSPLGTYTADNNYFTVAVTNNTLTAPAGAGGGSNDNGIYNYQANPSFPSLGGSKTNYWVDILIAPNIGSACGLNCFFNIPYRKVQN